MSLQHYPDLRETLKRNSKLEWVLRMDVMFKTAIFVEHLIHIIRGDEAFSFYRIVCFIFLEVGLAAFR